jgi:hypothetical protein
MSQQQFAEVLSRDSTSRDKVIGTANLVLGGTVTVENGKKVVLNDNSDWFLPTKSETYSLSTFSKIVRPLVNSWLITNNHQYIVCLDTLIEDWQSRTFVGEHWKWQPTIASIRLENLMYAFALVWNREGAASDRARRRWANLLINHVRYIEENLEIASANNHLIFNLVAVLHFYLSIEHKDAFRGIIDRHWMMLEEQLEEQILKDGGSCELSTYYHMIIAYWLISLLVLSRSQKSKSAEFLVPLLQKMLFWFKMVLRPDNSIPLLGDSYSESQFCNPNDLLILSGLILNDLESAQLSNKILTQNVVQFLNRESVEYYQSIEQARVRRDSYYFQDSGRCCFRSHLHEIDEFYAIFDCGSVGYAKNPAHGHADALSFEISVRGKPVFVDTGVSGYEESKWRNYFRGTRSHNTAVIDSQDQSILWKATRFKSSANVKVHQLSFSDTEDLIKASHDGYSRLADPVLHTRCFRVNKSSSEVLIADSFSGRCSHQLDLLFHLSPDCEATVRVPGRIEIAVDGTRVELVYDGRLKPSLYRGSDDPLLGWYAQRESEIIPCPCIALTGRFVGDFATHTIIRWK